MAMLSQLAHERSVAPDMGRLIETLIPYGESLPRASDDGCLIGVARRDFEKAVKIPSDWVARANAHGAASYQEWTRARPANDLKVGPLPRKDARTQPRIFRILRTVRPSRRSSYRRRR